MKRSQFQARGVGVSPERARLRGALAWIWVVFWLMFLVAPVLRNITDGGRHTAGALLLILGGVIYAPVIIAIMRRLWRGKPRTGTGEVVAAAAAMGVAACMLGAAPLIGQDAFALIPYAVVIFAMGMNRRIGGTLALSLVTATYSLSEELTGETLQSGLLVAALASGIAAGLGAFSAERTKDAEAAREDAALLRIQDERNRMARDVHDILGHSLTVITMKAELAGKLVDVDPEKAKAQIAELEQLSRSALADIRQTVSGYREMSLSGELARARRALTDAGLSVEMPGSTDDVAPDMRELFAWAVREATTNIIRHSGAQSCAIRLEPTRLQVSDDGRGVAESNTANSPGSGLAGLRERAAHHGARVITHTAGGFTLVVEAMPLDVPPHAPQLEREL